MRCGTRIAPVLALTLLVAGAAVQVSLAASSIDMSGFSIAGSRATATFQGGTYRITEGTDGQRIATEGAGHLMIPGRPMLPMKRFLVALPPGARARAVEVVRAETIEVPGTHRIEPCPPVLPLADSPHFQAQRQEMRREWQANYDATYSTDAAWPERIAWLDGFGSLRKYSYVSVGFCPFTYEPRSGRLQHHEEVEVRIEYDLPSPGTPEEQRVEELLHDRVADERAARLFANFRAIEALYEPVRPAGDRGEWYDYVIITTTDLVGPIASSMLPGYRTSVGHSLRTVLTTDSEITSQPGGDLAEQIRNFLRSYYPAWGIEYVLLVGDYTAVPMRICYPDPDFHVYNPGDPGLVAPGTPTDYYYADLSFPDHSSWDSDGDGYHGEYLDDSPDFLAEVAVGRVPVSDSTRVHYTLDKLVAFDQDTGSWKRNALLAGAILFFENQDHSGYPFVDGASCLDSIGTALMGGWTLSRFSEQAGLVVSSYPWAALTQTSFNTAWRTGSFAVVNWSGHGWCDAAARTIWVSDDGDGVPESSNGELQSRRFIGTGTSNLDDDYPSIVFAISCNVGYPEPNAYGNLGIDLLTQPGWGSSAGIVSSTRPAAVAGDWRADGGGTESICYEFNRYLLLHGECVGEALYDGKFFATSNYGWDHVYEYMNLYNFNLYGDPALMVDRSVATDIAEPRVAARKGALHLESARPNPFATATAFRFTIPERTHVTLEVVDVLGRKVRGLVDETMAANEYVREWDGRSDEGAAVSSGVYFYRMIAGDAVAARKVVLIR